MSGSELGLVVAVFLACAVEAVEALTIVLAVGIERSWRSAMWGCAAAIAALVVLVAVLGPAITAIPLGTLRVVIGGLLLVFGLGWLRKAILRAAGRKALHDETSIFAREREAARAADARDGLAGAAGGRLDGYAFAISFKGVLLEGLEVVVIVITFGANAHHVPLAALAAIVAVVLVAAIGTAARAPLARVPENTLKFSVGVLLCAYGMFWAGEGAGAHWPGGDAALLVIVPGLIVVSVALVTALRVPSDAREPA